MYQTWPAMHSMLADPAVFPKEVVVIRIQGGKQYTAQDHQQLFQDAGMPLARELADAYIGFIQFATPEFYPNVDIYVEKGSGISTLAGVELKELKVATHASNVSKPLWRDGDGEIEDIANDSIRVWEKMPCYHFEFNDNPGVGHGLLPYNSDVLQRLLTHLRQPRSVCPSK